MSARFAVLVAVVALSLALGPAGCGGDGDDATGEDGAGNGGGGGGRGGDQPGDGAIRGVIDGLWEATGVDRGRVVTSPYRRETKRDVARCADLPDESDRWIAYRTSWVPGEVHTQDDLFEPGATYLEDEGFTVARYHQPASGTLALRAERDDLVVYLDVQDNGYAHAEVIAGPCAPLIADEPPRHAEPLR
jgi:hypothetical protein